MLHVFITGYLIDGVLGLFSLQVDSLCANNANVTQAMVFSRLVSEDVGICWADGRSSGAALTPDPPQMSHTRAELRHEGVENQ